MVAVKDVQVAVAVAVGPAVEQGLRPPLQRLGRRSGQDDAKAVQPQVIAVLAASGEQQGIIDKIEGGVHGLLRELGIAQRDDIADVDQRIAELEHRIRLLEEAAGTAPSAPADAGE